jgi:hypothetical protein
MDNAQKLLDCLALFCDITGMVVNTDSPDKTCVVAFSKPRAVVGTVHLTYKGVALPVKDEHVYLGVLMHATKGHTPALSALAAAGSQAKHSVLCACRQRYLTQFDIKCRVFDALVEPVMSYACQIWGPYMLAPAAMRQTPWVNAADRVHLSFLRDMAGVGHGVSIEVLLRDFNRKPLANRWIKLACRWWSTLADMDATRVAHMAWMSDIALMVAGCKHCWTYKLLSILTTLNILPAALWDPEVNHDVSADTIARLSFEEKDVVAAMDAAAASRWLGLHPSPRDAGAEGHEKSIYAGWIMPMPAAAAVDRGSASGGVANASATLPAPPHTKLCMPFASLQCLAQFRLGWHHLESQVARQRRSQTANGRVPWHQRWCRVCSIDRAPCEHARLASGAPPGAEDLRHFLLECPAYDAIRHQQHPDVFAVASGIGNGDARVAAIFSAPSLVHQQQLAQCLLAMVEHRTALGVRRHRGAGRAVQQQQQQHAAPHDPALQALDALDHELSALGIIATSE